MSYLTFLLVFHQDNDSGSLVFHTAWSIVPGIFFQFLLCFVFLIQQPLEYFLVAEKKRGGKIWLSPCPDNFMLTI